MSEQLKIQPYARLITMLGDQLIKNELVALVELIKNAYDADASWVKVSFVNFADDFTSNEDSKIVIEDDGCGMNDDILRKHWLNPATPEKLRRKKENGKTEKGRILQGEKGIGRFAVFKLGRTIRIITRRQKTDDKGRFVEAGENVENQLLYDFSQYDDDFLTENGVDKELFLEDLSVSLIKEKPSRIVGGDVVLGTNIYKRKDHGTIIEISNIKTKWSQSRIERVLREVGKLQPIFSDNSNSDFNVWLYKDDKVYSQGMDYRQNLIGLLQTKSVLAVKDGHYHENDRLISFILNDREYRISLDSSEIVGLKQYDYFKGKDRNTECGDFGFEFYVFDFNVNTEDRTKYYLSPDEKQLIKNHRIYLYRDAIRVMPYGDPEDDWLQIDVARGTIRADEYLSNDQVVGCVYISGKDNANLKDKTNREGLIDEGNGLSDFVAVLKLILKYLRSKPYAQYLVDKKKKREFDEVKKGRTTGLIKAAKEKYAQEPKILKLIDSFESSYSKEKKVYEERIPQ